MKEFRKLKLWLQTKYKNSKLFIAVALVLGIVVGLVIGYGVWHEGDTIEKALVVSVIDGDTIELQDGNRVRYLGIDTPETGEPYYSEATARNKELELIDQFVGCLGSLRLILVKHLVPEGRGCLVKGNGIVGGF